MRDAEITVIATNWPLQPEKFFQSKRSATLLTALQRIQYAQQLIFKSATMYKNISVNLKSLWPALAISAAVVLALFLWQSHKGIHFADEGFLWYGAQRVMTGEVPMRDFYAYDIGRYYFSAAFMSLWGNNGIVALRVGSAVFQAIALFVGLTLLARTASPRHRAPFLLLSAITLAAWMPFQYRLYDSSLPIMLIGALAFLIERPSPRRYFLVGLTVGLAAVFGKNHGLYGVLGSAATLLYLGIKNDTGSSPIKGFVFWVIGTCIGYLPVLLFLVFVPGFFHAFVDSILVLFEINATNIPLPVPWPWLAPFGKAPLDSVARSVLGGTFFIAIVVFAVLGVVWVIRRKFLGKPASPALVASTLLALPYAHYAYSRADFSHLIPGIPPMLIGVLALLSNQPAKIKWPFAGIFCAISMYLVAPSFSGWQCYSKRNCVEVVLAEDKIEVDKGTASLLAVFNKLNEQFSGGQAFLSVPFTPGLYAALQRKSPMWENYALVPRSNEFQQAEIARIQTANIGFAVIHDSPLDGRDELRFHNTHPLIDQYIRNNFQLLPGYLNNPAFQLFIRKEATR